MNYDIQIIRDYEIKCENCDFEIQANSPGMAEGLAKDHIDEYADGNETNLYHVVRIMERTRVGRNV
jgi:hypothetical protein